MVYEYIDQEASSTGDVSVLTSEVKDLKQQISNLQQMQMMHMQFFSRMMPPASEEDPNFSIPVQFSKSAVVEKERKREEMLKQFELKLKSNVEFLGNLE